MELIFYDKASEILGITSDVLRQAVSRGELTRAGLQGNRQRLIEEQVRLYTGKNPRTGRKKRISYDALSPQEQAAWHRYENELVASQSAGRITPDVERLIDEKISAFARLRLSKIEEEERIASEQARIASELARVREAEKEELRPFLVRELQSIA